MFQGKVSADVRIEGPAAALRHVPDWRVPRRRGETGECARADPAGGRGGGRGGDPSKARSAVPRGKQAVDLTQAERIVSVGRGIKSQEHIEVARQLAEALGAELAASRPICDAGWLPMERQIGSSGQTVAPKLYVASASPAPSSTSSA
jgi:electron transfer flavoprotein alpha subunit